MNRINFTKGLLASVVALVLGVFAMPQPASAFVAKSGLLAHGQSTCVHRPDCYEQTHRVRLKAGVNYVITLTSPDFDTYLFLENDSGNLLMSNDDAPGLGLNSRMFFTPSYSGTYTIVVSSFRQGATGTYNLTVAP